MDMGRAIRNFAPLSIFFGLFLVIFTTLLNLVRPTPQNNLILHFILKIWNNVLRTNTALLRALGFEVKKAATPYVKELPPNGSSLQKAQVIYKESITGSPVQSGSLPTQPR